MGVGMRVANQRASSGRPDDEGFVLLPTRMGPEVSRCAPFAPLYATDQVVTGGAKRAQARGDAASAVPRRTRTTTVPASRTRAEGDRHGEKSKRATSALGQVASLTLLSRTSLLPGRP